METKKEKEICDECREEFDTLIKIDETEPGQKNGFAKRYVCHDCAMENY
jgi:hypothetical protein